MLHSITPRFAGHLRIGDSFTAQEKAGIESGYAQSAFKSLVEDELPDTVTIVLNKRPDQPASQPGQLQIELRQPRLTAPFQGAPVEETALLKGDVGGLYAPRSGWVEGLSDHEIQAWLKKPLAEKVLALLQYLLEETGEAWGMAWDDGDAEFSNDAVQFARKVAAAVAQRSYL